jgi:CHRD domain
VVANDLDPVDDTNVHGLNSQAIAVADPLTGGPMLNPLTGMPMITASQATTAGGTVRRTINIATGEATFLYNPPVDFTGIDSFRYVVQDQGGLISTPATVTITVEDLQVGRADFRLRTGKWKLSGNSSDKLDNRVTLTAGPRTRLTPEATVATPAVTSSAQGSAVLRVSNTTIDFALDFDTLPASNITAAHIHVGAPGTNGPVIFSLFQSGLDGPLTGSRRGTLQTFHLQTRPSAGVSSFGDALNAILSGNAYVDVHTTAFPNGELRGQFARPTLGSADVSATGWEFQGHSPVSPGALPSVIVESTNGIQVIGIPLRLR